MSSPPRSREREAERRLSVQTLAIASIASAVAAIVVSQFWAGGTPIAAAVTPVIVALVSEMLHRPTQAIARRVTSERTAILPADMLERERPPDEPKREEPAREERSREEPPVRVYATQRAPRGRRKIAVGVVVTTAVLAFAIAAAALTLPELIAGHSITGSDRKTTLIPTKKKKSSSSDEGQQQTTTTPQEQGTQTTPQEKPKATTPTPTETETTPTQTQTTPKSQPK